MDLDARDAIQAGLRAFNDRHWPALRGEGEPAATSWPLDVYARVPDARLVGGLTGYTVWDWFYVERLWVEAPLRGRGLGARLMAEAEAEARRRGAHHAHLRTYSFQARGFYEALGYRVVGTLDDYPPGGQFYWMRKDFT